MSAEYKRLSKEATYRLIHRAHQGDERAKEELVSSNTGLVKNLALKFMAQGYELEDLMQVGFIGLLKAIDRFDPQFDVMFSTYAVPMILGEIKRYLRDDGKIKISRQTKQDVKKMRAVFQEFVRREGVSPRLSQIARLMGESQERITYLMEAQEALYGMESLDDPDCAAGRTAQSGGLEERIVDRLHLKEAIGELSQREQKILLLRYFRDMTQQQIADRMGMSQVQVSRIEKKIMERLRKEMKEKTSP